MKTNNKVELLAPCGNLSILKTAVDAGADSVYLGLKEFSARASADNFTLDELEEVVVYEGDDSIQHLKSVPPGHRPE